MRALIAVNGIIEDYAAIARRLHADDLLIGADGGAAHWLAMGRRPHVVVGDLDSLPPAVVNDFIAQGVQVERHPCEKDQTDLELAIERALADGASEVLLIGALGGRLDQTLANLLILAQRAWTTPVRIMEGDQLAEILRGPGALDLHGPPGATVSLIPLSETVRGGKNNCRYSIPTASARQAPSISASRIVRSAVVSRLAHTAPVTK